MNYLMMETELLWMLSVSGLKPAAVSAVRLSDVQAAGQSGTPESLSQAGLLTDGLLSQRGQAIAASLLMPECMLEAAGAAGADTPVVSCCRRSGVWTVLLREPYQGIVNVLYPVPQANIREVVTQALFPGGLPAQAAFCLSLTAPEAAVFELSHFVIEQRVQELGRPLQKEEQSFTAADIFSEENLLRLALKLARLPEAAYGQAAASIRDPRKLVRALTALKDKGVFDCESAPGGARFFHTPMARTWLMGDARMDTVTVQNICPAAETELYHRMETGLLRISQRGDAILYESVPAPRLLAADAPAGAGAICPRCGRRQDGDEAFCSGCDAKSQ